MIWSKLKKTAEALLAEPLKGRVAYHLTRYGPGVSHMMTRGWVTFDQDEILNCATSKWIRENHQLTGEWYSHDPQAIERLEEQGIFTRQDFVAALETYVVIKVEAALQSEDPLIRAFAMFDRRVGKRTLQEISFRDDETPFVSKFYRIRCEVEGLLCAQK